VPTSHSTTASWILKAYEDTKLQVVQSLENATSKATLSFDRWTANNKVLDLLGIITHYLDKDYKNRVVVLDLRDALRSHSGINIADHLLSVINDFLLSDKITYFTADNATNNDKALSILSGFYP
jgi:Cdc6-like AAA superfamily ATPase